MRNIKEIFQLYHEEKYLEAKKMIEELIHHAPHNSVALNLYGAILTQLKQNREAVVQFEKAIACDPNKSEYHYNLGIVLECLGEYQSAIAHYDVSIQLNPNDAKAYCNRGKAYSEIPEWDKALEDYDQAIRLKNPYPLAYINKAMILLTLGRYLEGFELYEWRMRRETYTALDTKPRDFIQPLWNGQTNLAGITILLTGEQGAGDDIMFCRYAAELKKLGASIIIEVRESLYSLMKTNKDVDFVIKSNSFLPAFDLHCPLGSLPYAFKTELNSIPNNVPYLYADPERLTLWSEQLGKKTRPRIGIVWKGQKLHDKYHVRNIPLDKLIEILPKNFQYVSLQKVIEPDDLKILEEANIFHQENQLNDFSDTAALAELMDLVISIDTSVAHLAGALGRPTWIMIPHIPDWRWMPKQESNPWYPTAKLYRQEQNNDWDHVLKKLYTDLRTWSK